MRGDDAVALADARALTALQKAVEAKAEAMGFAHPQRLVDRGEVLREKKDPSVSELMAMRIREIDPGGPVDRNSPEQFKVRSANQMAAMLAEWDTKAALPILKARVKHCAQVVRAGQRAGGRFHGMEDAIAGLTELRLEAADPQALEDYAAWVRTVTPGHFDFPPIAMFKPMWQNPDHPRDRRGGCAIRRPKIALEPSIRRGDATVAEGQHGVCSPAPCSA